jgi:hypothetical protein
MLNIIKKLNKIFILASFYCGFRAAEETPCTENILYQILPYLKAGINTFEIPVYKMYIHDMSE